MERILAARGTPRRLAEYVAEDLTRRIVLNMGVDPLDRDLTEYDRLPLAGVPASHKGPRTRSRPPALDGPADGR